MPVMSYLAIQIPISQSVIYINALAVLFFLLAAFSCSVFSFNQKDCFSSDANQNYVLNGNCSCHNIMALTLSSEISIMKINFSVSDGTNTGHATGVCNDRRLHLINSLLQMSRSGFISFNKLTTLNLSRNFLTRIPDFLPEKLRRLDLSGNRIIDVEAKNLLFVDFLEALYIDDNFITSISNRTNTGGKFWQNMHLSNLRRLSMQRNKIHVLNSFAFKHLAQLTMLSLSGNQISSLQMEAFDGLDRLTDLDLSDNILLHISDYTFQRLTSLTFLSVKGNHLTSLPKGVPMLEWFDISFNSLQNISEDFKPEILAVEFTNFAHNPLLCDCHLLWLKEAYDRREYVIQYLNINPLNVIPTCHSPEHLLNESWDVLSDDAFVCEHSPDPVVNLDPKLKMESKDIVKALVVKGEVLNESSIVIVWKFKSTVFPHSGFIISYYVFGLKSSTLRHIQVAATERQCTLSGLSSQSNYMICVNLVKTELNSETKYKSFPVLLDHCLELTTKAHRPSLEMTCFTVYWWYILTMITTFFIIVGFITGLALLCSFFNRRHISTSKPTYPVDEPLC